MLCLNEVSYNRGGRHTKDFPFKHSNFRMIFGVL